MGRRVLSLAAALLAAILLFAAPASAHPAWGIVVGGDGGVYFSDLETVWRIGPDGRLSVFRPGVADVHVHELALAPNGDLLGTQNGYDPDSQVYSSGIWRRDASGRETWPVPMTADAPRGAGPWRDRAGNSYVTSWVSNDDRRTMVFRRSSAGEVRLLFGDPAAARKPSGAPAADLGGLVLAPDGALIFTDRISVRRVAPDGAATILYSGGGKGMLLGLALAPDGTLYAADLGERRLLAIGKDGKTAIAYRSAEGWTPSGVAFGGGRLLVLEAEEDPAHRSHRVRVVEVKDGKANVIAAPGQPVAGGDPAPAQAPPRPLQASAAASVAALALVVVIAIGFFFGVRRMRDRYDH